MFTPLQVVSVLRLRSPLPSGLAREVWKAYKGRGVEHTGRQLQVAADYTYPKPAWTSLFRHIM